MRILENRQMNPLEWTYTILIDFINLCQSDPFFHKSQKFTFCDQSEFSMSQKVISRYKN